MLLAKRNEPAKALELLTQAVALQPRNHALRMNLAKVQIQLGDKAKARTELETLLKAEGTAPLRVELEALMKSL